MAREPLVYVSNQTEKLVDFLGENLFSHDSAPFVKQHLFLPNHHLKNLIITKLIKEKEGALLGLSFEELGSGIQDLFKVACAKENLLFPPLDILSLHLEEVIHSFLSTKKNRVLNDYFSHLTFELEKRKKIQGLAKALAKEFLSYGKFGGEVLEQWKKKKGWQQEIWEEIFSYWNYPYELLNEAFPPPSEEREIHLFNFPFLPKIYHKFFAKLALHWKVVYYQFSPCNEFWTDIVSDRERFYIQGKERKKKNSTASCQELESYLVGRNPLLANFGTLLKKTFLFFEDENFLLKEENEPIASQTLLQKVQKDIFSFEYEKKETIPVEHSISLNSAQSKLREVEILDGFISHLIKDSKIGLSDIQIFAPDIAEYAPYIQYIFSRKEIFLDFQIQDMPTEHKSPFLKSFFELISFSEQRFEFKNVEKLFLLPSFYKKFKLEEKEVKLFFRWMEKQGVSWGVDSKQRNQLVSYYHPKDKMLEDGEEGTWNYAFKKLLLSLVFIREKQAIFSTPLVNFSEAETLGLCTSLIRQLREDFCSLSIKEQTLKEWVSFLYKLIDTYLLVGEEDLRFFHRFKEKLQMLSRLGGHLETALFPFSSIKDFLNKSFKEKTGTITSKQLEALTFKSLKLGSAFPSKVICLLGMCEDTFPRRETLSSLKEVKGDFSPTKSEEDKALFLELLLSAKETFYMSYLNINEKDGKEVAPSLPIQELFSYLDQSYEIGESLPSKVLKHAHPPFAFHESYFQKESLSPSLSKREHLTALSLYEHKDLAPFIPEFFKSLPPSKHKIKSQTIQLKELKQCASHPFRFYLNQTLGIYLQYEGLETEFSLSPLTQAILRGNTYDLSLEETLKEAQEEGKLPLGRFGESATLRIKEEYEEKKHHMLNTFSIRKEDLIHVELKAHCKEVLQVKKGHMVLPALQIALSDQHTITIEGSLYPITSEGLIVHADKKMEDLVKIWPLYLVFSCLERLGVKKNLLLSKTGKTVFAQNGEEALKKYLIYYMRAKESPSPFLPTWANTFLKKDKKGLQKEIGKSLTQKMDPYICHLLGEKKHFSSETIFEAWAPLLQKTFSPLVLL